MNIIVIASSTRADAQSRKIAEYIKTDLENRPDTTAGVIDLHELALPVFDTNPTDAVQEMVKSVLTQLAAADGFVFVSPEWDGMMSVGLLNLFHYVGLEMADKPVYLVGVSSGRGGQYPLLQMRSMGYKNRHFVVIPESFFVQDVTNEFADGVFTDQRNADRVAYGLDTLLQYAAALAQVRSSGVLNYEQYRNGL